MRKDFELRIKYDKIKRNEDIGCFELQTPILKYHNIL